MATPSLPPAPPDVEADPMPVVARGGQGVPAWMLVGFGIIAALLLFAVLNAKRHDMAEAPTTASRSIDSEDLPASPPVLELPPEPVPEPLPPAPYLPQVKQTAPQQPAIARLVPQAQQQQPVPSNPPVTNNRPSTSLPSPNGAAAIGAGSVSPGSAVVVDSSTPQDNGNTNRNFNNSGNGNGGTLASGGRVHASMLANRGTTVPQGTLIPAVLESGFDSTRPGFARAIVSRNVPGFDGQHVLIPRGSRLIGEYQADSRPGQNRALIIWSRLIRPDGATIEIGSPVADTVGRGGVKAKVNSHFLTRFGGAILQSALNAGVNIASQSAGGAVVLALPNTGTATGNLIQPNNVQPTLKVKPGTSISVFVAHDLDFTEVENP